jgi:Thiamine pyrophosphate enzyme, N-terminal TPP binding domain
MASAYAKFTGRLGVCMATSGPGASHLLTGLYDARLDHMPVLAIAGQQSRNAMGGHFQQEVDLHTMFKDVAGAFVEQASAPAQVRHLADRAIRIAIGERMVTVLIFPKDLQELPYHEHKQVGSGNSGHAGRAPRPPQHRDLAEKMVDAEPDVLAIEIDADLAARDEIDRVSVVAAAHDEFASLNCLCSQQPHDVGDRRRIEPEKQRHRATISHHEIAGGSALKRRSRHRQRDHDKPPQDCHRRDELAKLVLLAPTSPYPIAPSVTIDHHMASGMVPNLSGCASRSARWMNVALIRVAPAMITEHPNSAPCSA